MKFFGLKITLGLALGESWPLLAQPQKNTDVYKACFRGKAFPGKPAKITFGENKGVLVAGWPGLDKGTPFLVPHVWKSHTHNSLSLQEISSLPKNR